MCSRLKHSREQIIRFSFSLLLIGRESSTSNAHAHARALPSSAFFSTKLKASQTRKHCLPECFSVSRVAEPFCFRKIRVFLIFAGNIILFPQNKLSCTRTKVFLNLNPLRKKEACVSFVQNCESSCMYNYVTSTCC